MTEVNRVLLLKLVLDYIQQEFSCVANARSKYLNDWNDSKRKECFDNSGQWIRMKQYDLDDYMNKYQIFLADSIEFITLEKHLKELISMQ
jgi:hypothetical protein